MDHREHIASLLANMAETSSAAYEVWDRAAMRFGDPDYDTTENAAWSIETAFLQLLAATEILRLDALKQLVLEDIVQARKVGFAKGEMGPDEPHSVWMARHRQYIITSMVR